LLQLYKYASLATFNNAFQEIQVQEKRCAYDERVREVEKACFYLLVFSASGSMGSSDTTCLQEVGIHVSGKVEYEL